MRSRRGGGWSTGSRHRRTVPGRGDLEDLFIGPLLLRLGLDVQEEVAARGGHVVRICWVAMGELLSRSLARGRRRRDGRETSWVIDGASELRRVRDEPLARGPEPRAAGCAARAGRTLETNSGRRLGYALRVQGKSAPASAGGKAWKGADNFEGAFTWKGPGALKGRFADAHATRSPPATWPPSYPSRARIATTANPTTWRGSCAPTS